MATAAAASDPDSQMTELTEEIQLQEILLSSLSGTTEDTPAKRSKFQADILTLKERLRKLRAAQTSTPTSHSSMNGISGYHAFRDGQGFPHSTGYGNDRRAQPTGDEPTRKRTYSNHLGTIHPSFPAQKSRRTTPDLDSNANSPFGEDWGDSEYMPFVDLTGLKDEDGIAWKQQQTAEERRFNAAKKQEEQDRILALELSRGGSGPSKSTSNSASSTSRLPSQSGPNAFHQIQGRSQIPSPHPLAASSSSGVKTEQVKREPTYENGFNSYNDRRLPDIPTRVKPEEPPPAVSGHMSGSRMPGTYDFDDDEDDYLFALPPRGPSAMGHSNGVSYPSFHPASTLPPTSDDALAAFMPHNYPGLTGYNGGPSSHVYSHPQFGDLLPPFAPPMGPRPGTLTNGSANLLPSGHRSNLTGYQTGRSLADVVDLTGSYDYRNGTDQYGNALPEQIRSYVEDYMGDEKKTVEQIQDLLANVAADMEVPPEGQEGSPDGLKVFLYRHQKIALKWMESMEVKDSKGGILADDMGLGKTISTIALMLSRRVQWSSTFGDPRPVKTNVIVGPVALLRQWEREIKKKVNHRHELTVHNYHQKKIDYKALCQFDVVLVTYGTLAAELKKFEKYIQDVSKAGGGGVDQAWLLKNCPFLGNKSTFYRVILDEAQCIKNRNTKAATACRKIQAQYRWCLTGTPMMNSISELSSLIEYLRIEPFCDFRRFNKTFGCLSVTRARAGYQSREGALKSLQILLKGIMLRRSKSSMIDGKPIINLPPKVETIDHVVFNEDENSFYQDLERESQVKVSKYLQQGTIGKHYSMALVLLLRLRQACCHPYLHLTDLDYGSGEIPEDVLTDLARRLEPGVVDRIKAADGAFECPICYDSVPNPSIMLPCGHDTCQDCLVRLTGNAQQDNLQNGVEGNDLRCPECRGPIDMKKVITYAIFKQVHMPETVEKPVVVEEVEDDDETQSEVDSDDDETESEEDDNTDVDEHGDLKNFIVDDDDEGVDRVDPDDDDFDDDLDMPKSKPNKGKGKMRRKIRKSKKSKGKKKEDDVLPHMLKDLRKEAGKNIEAHRTYMRYLKKIWHTSAKVSKCTELIADIQQTGEKTIVFSQWTLLLDLLEIPIKSELKLGFRRYDGGMSSMQRDNAVNDFIERSDVKVILVSLKAGNAGLNLTAASQVIIMDPFWNPYIEMQAIDRAHRIGQNNTVKVHRVLVQETVEDRIVALQEKKRALVDSALDEGATKGVGRLSHDDIAYLFGFGSGR